MSRPIYLAARHEDTPAELSDESEGHPPPPGLRHRIPAFLIAVVTAGLVTDLAWRRIPRALSVTTDVVGSTTFDDFNVFRYHDAYYLMAGFFPLATTCVYLALRRWGPLKARSETRRAWPPHLKRDVLDRLERPSYPAPTALLRVGVVGAAVGLVSATAWSTSVQDSKRAGLLAAVLYVLLVLGTAALRRVYLQRYRVGGRSRLSATRMSDLVPSTNAVGCTFLLVGLYLVSRRTRLTVESAHRTISYPWIPLWLVAALMTAIAAWMYIAAHRPGGSWRRIEITALCAMIGSTLLYLLSANFTPVMGAFNGFDDSHSLVGAQLTFHHGLVLWRDLYLLHGPLYDDLNGILGLHIFGHGRWGAANGMSLIVYPMTSVSVFIFAAYFLRRRYLALTGIGLALLLGTLPSIEPRFIFLPPLLMLFDQVLRRRSTVACGAFSVAVLVEVILTPETALLAISLFLIIPVFELVHREPGTSIRASLYRTWQCAAWAIAASLVWVLILVSMGALSGFVDYFLTAAPGHALAGAFPYGPLTSNLTTTTELFLPPVLLVMTYWRSASKLLTRASWTSREWVMVASAGMVALYYTKGLDRIDGYHVYEVFAVSLPLLILWTGLILDTGGDAAKRLTSRSLAFNPFALTGLAAVALFSPLGIGSVIDAGPHYRGTAPTNPPSSQPRLGYTYPGAVDLAQINDLKTVLDTYAGPNGPVYDFSNDAGVTNYLLDRLPGTRFYDPALAQTTLAQTLLVDDLKRSRPRVIIFNNDTFGLFNFDGITSMIREYLAGQYILDNYHPLLDTHGQLIFLRDDLLAAAPPTPTLSTPPTTTDLYFDMPSCNWGDVPNFFAVPDAIKGSRVQLPLTVGAPDETDSVTVTGWVFDRDTGTAPSSVEVVSDGHVIDRLPLSQARPDVAAFLHNATALKSGFTGNFQVDSRSAWSLGAVLTNGGVIPLSAATTDRASGLAGHIDAIQKVATYTYQLQPPSGHAWSDYQWIHLAGSRPFGRSSFTIVDGSSNPNHSITFESLPRAGGSIFLRVGSCIQWHGYDSATLALRITGSSLTPQASLLGPDR